MTIRFETLRSCLSFLSEDVFLIIKSYDFYFEGIERHKLITLGRLFPIEKIINIDLSDLYSINCFNNDQNNYLEIFDRKIGNFIKKLNPFSTIYNIIKIDDDTILIHYDGELILYNIKTNVIIANHKEQIHNIYVLSQTPRETIFLATTCNSHDYSFTQLYSYSNYQFQIIEQLDTSIDILDHHILSDNRFILIHKYYSDENFSEELYGDTISISQYCPNGITTTDNHESKISEKEYKLNPDINQIKNKYILSTDIFSNTLLLAGGIHQTKQKTHDRQYNDRDENNGYEEDKEDKEDEENEDEEDEGDEENENEEDEGDKEDVQGYIGVFDIYQMKMIKEFILDSEIKTIARLENDKCLCFLDNRVIIFDLKLGKRECILGKYNTSMVFQVLPSSDVAVVVNESEIMIYNPQTEYYHKINFQNKIYNLKYLLDGCQTFLFCDFDIEIKVYT